jgi:high-affinity nickel-transport protein
MAGSAAIALIVLAAISDPVIGMLYLALFGLGTIAGMIVVTALLAFPAAMAVTEAGVSRRWLTVASGLVSLAFGILMVHGLGGPLALLAADPSFHPR